MPYTSHGHWYGPGEPTMPAPNARARCGGPRLCAVCKREAGQIEYACRFTSWTNTDGKDRQVTKYDQTGAGEAGLLSARTLAKQTRAWQPHHDLPADAVVVSRPVPEWTVVEEN